MLTGEGLAIARGGRTLLEGLALAFAPGTVTAFLGPNGAGKTSLLRTLAGLAAPAAGRVGLDSRPLDTLAPAARARRIGYLAQEAPVHWNLAAAEVVALGRLPHRVPFAGPDARDRRAIERAMAATGTDDLAGRPIGACSGGERARVLLARLLAGEPDWILADEPLANLDPAQQLRTLAILKARADAGVGVILVLHDLGAAARIADRLLLLGDGRVHADGPPSVVITPEHVAAAFGVSIRLVADPLGPLVVPLAPLG
jgi:iron complex transport system ATP-binding protein